MSFNLNTKVNLNDDNEPTATTYKIDIRGLIAPIVKYNDWYIPLNIAKALTGYDHKQSCKLFKDLEHVRANVFINNGDLDDGVFNYNLFFIRFNDAIEVIRSKKKSSVGKIKRIAADEMISPMVAYAMTLPVAKLQVPDDIRALPRVTATTVAQPIRKRKSRSAKPVIVEKQSSDESSDYDDSDSDESDESDEIVEPPRKKQKITQCVEEPQHVPIKSQTQQLFEEFWEFQEFKRLREMRK
ncbi:hypothetical protein F-M6_0245 [Faustovirus]|nr:hypothetical protein F-M6_0245 [Faustovirus]